MAKEGLLWPRGVQLKTKPSTAIATMARSVCLCLLTISICLGCAHKQTPQSDGLKSVPDRLKTIATFRGAQVTGVTSTDTGRLFANFPRWREGVPFSVVEVSPDGSFTPYPDAEWNRWEGYPQPDRFTCVQSVVAHGDSLYVLDPSNPQFAGVVGSAKLFVFDLKTNRLKRRYEFHNGVAPERSYLNDLRIDDAAGKIYITDSGLGAIIVVDTATGNVRRLLAHHASTKAEEITLRIDGKEFLRNGKPPRIHSDGIELDRKNGYLYYHALTGYHLYRVPTSALAAAFFDPRLEAALEAKVEDLGKTPAPDGMMFDAVGNLYMGDLEHDAIVYRTPAGEILTLVQDPRIRWADTFTIDPNDSLIFTASRIHQVPQSGGIEEMEFPIYSLQLPPSAAPQ
uniref:Major royal jelly protein n=1 Tax=Geobacter sp. (strain M21) TaxID=443144 RepID=C6E3B9_GEOSM